MIDVDNILEKVNELEWRPVFEELMARVRKGDPEAVYAVNLEDHNLVIRNLDTIEHKEYALLCLSGSDHQIDYQSASLMINLSSMFCLWQIQLAEINYYCQNASEFQGMNLSELTQIIQGANLGADTAGLGNFALEKEQPAHLVIDIRNGQTAYAVHNEIQPYEFPIFTILPYEDKGQQMSAAMNLFRAIEPIKQITQHNLKLLYAAHVNN